MYEKILASTEAGNTKKELSKIKLNKCRLRAVCIIFRPRKFLYEESESCSLGKISQIIN